LGGRFFYDSHRPGCDDGGLALADRDDGVRQFRFFRFFRFRRDRFFNLDRVLQILDGFGQFFDALLEVGNVLHLVFQSAEAGIIVPAQDQCHGDQQDDDGKLNFYHTAASL
jgi:hypothetical protein